MLNINQVFLSGNVVADAELRYTKKGEKRYVTEVVAQNLTYGLKQNESQSNFDGYGEEEEKIPF